MFRKIKNNEDDVIILYKNYKEELCQIPVNFINSISYKEEDVNVIEMSIPNYTVNFSGATVRNPVFDNILGKMQSLKLNDEDKYVITDCSVSEDITGRKTKSVTAKSLDCIINENDFYIPTGGITRQLYKTKNDKDVSEGILNLFEEDNIGWSIGHVDDTAMFEITPSIIEHEVRFDDIRSNSTKKNTVMFERDFSYNTTLKDNEYLSIKFKYGQIISKLNGLSDILKEEKIENDLGVFHTLVKNVKATYTTSDKYRFCMRYELTLEDNSKVTKECEFVDLNTYDVYIPNPIMTYSNSGEIKDVTNLKYRNFEQGVYKWLDFLRNNVSESYDVIFKFDTINKVVNCYSRSTYGKDTGLMLGYDNFIKDINKKYQYDDIVTKMYVSSDKKDISIVSQNPTGRDYILNYDYFIKNKLMSDSCINAFNTYTKSLEQSKDKMADFRSKLYNLNSKRIKIESQISTLNETIKGLEVIRIAYIKALDDVNVLKMSTEINAKQDEVKASLAELSKVKDDINSTNREIDEAIESISMEKMKYATGENVFKKDDLEEIQQLTISNSYVDKYYLTDYSLYQNAKEVIAEKNKLQIDFDISVEGFLQKLVVMDGMKWNEVISIGDYVYIDDNELNDSENKIRIISIDYSPKDKRITKIGFTNKLKKITSLNGITKIGNTIARVDNYTNKFRDTWQKSVDTNAYIDSVLKDGMDARATAVRSSGARCKYNMTEAGLFVIDNLDNGNEDNQIYVGSSMICITNDRWQTCKTAIDAQGIVASEIVGDLLLGHNLRITNGANSFSIDEKGIEIHSDNLKITGLENAVSTKSFADYYNELKSKIEESTNGQIAKVIGNVALLKTHARDNLVNAINEISDEVTTGLSSFDKALSGTLNGVNPDTFKGTDVQKLQQAMDYAIAHDFTDIIISRRYNLTGGTVVFNKKGEFPRQPLKFISNGGSIIKTDSGAMFKGDTFPTGEIQFKSMTFIGGWDGAEHPNTICFDMDNLIRINTSQCYFKNFETIYHSSEGKFIQTLKSTADTFIHSNKVVECGHAWDITFVNGLCENDCGHFIKQSPEGSDLINQINIVGTTIENLKGWVIEINGVQGLNVSGCYMEDNANWFRFHGFGVKGGTFSGNFITNMTKSDNWLFYTHSSPDGACSINLFGNHIDSLYGHKLALGWGYITTIYSCANHFGVNVNWGQLKLFKDIGTDEHS